MNVQQSSQNFSAQQLVIAEPLAINYNSEIALARLTEVIQRAEITDAQRAKLYYERGVMYDSVGLRSLARLDFNRALRLKPDLIDAHNFLGIHYTLMQEFNQAYDAFDSALELAPNHEYALLNRGIALYYGGRAELALADITAFLQLKENDPYRMVWLFLVASEKNETAAKLALQTQAKSVADNIWAKSIIQLYLNEITLEDFARRLKVNITSNKMLNERLCEAYFYLGKYHQLSGNNAVAMNFFKLALSTNVYEFVEHRYAKLELDLVRASVVNTSELSH